MVTPTLPHTGVDKAGGRAVQACFSSQLVSLTYFATVGDWDSSATVKQGCLSNRQTQCILKAARTRTDAAGQHCRGCVSPMNGTCLAILLLVAIFPSLPACPAVLRGKVQYGSIHPAVSSAWRACLAGKKILFMGNSITRHWLFDTAFLLRGSEDNSSNSRGKEKKICGNGAVLWPGDTCHLKVQGVTLNFTWMWEVHRWGG